MEIYGWQIFYGIKMPRIKFPLLLILLIVSKASWFHRCVMPSNLGNPMFDIAKIMTCTDDKTRRDFEKGFIALYYAVLENEVGSEQLVDVGQEKLEKAYRFASVLNLISKAMSIVTNKDVPSGVAKKEHELKFNSYLDGMQSALEDAVKFLEEEAVGWLK